MVKIALVAAWLVMAVPALPHLDAAERARRSKPRNPTAKVPQRTPRIIGIIQYDTGINAGFHPDFPAPQKRVVGNRFNSALGGPLLMTGMVSRLTLFPANDGNQSVTIATAPTTMNTAMVIEFFNVNLMAGQFNVIAFPRDVWVGPDFLGLFIGAFNDFQSAGLLGMSDMQNLGQGYHAIQGFYVAPLQVTMLQAVPNRNAMLRATLDMLVPVELMDFRVE